MTGSPAPRNFLPPRLGLVVGGARSGKSGLAERLVTATSRPRRYIATLGVIFDRARTGERLGMTGARARSAPMLLIPVEVSGGAYTTFEQRNAWQRAWAEFNPGTSRINYVRPSGAGGDSLLINFGQTARHSRVWWRSTLDQYGASDALMAFARLDHQFPGGPVSGRMSPITISVSLTPCCCALARWRPPWKSSRR